ncbi:MULTISPECIES: TadE/TadG family type IV pilus assembly protein [unclassified Fusibacter]|uniref:TadE/TadG family type IV pilus assembly protein n=1 Tax=unclassified Fusibacter TaxID=2624464 RepID=UPI001013C0DA|nr:MULTISPECIES: TadE/TadG family type IV pilus assembly protein [unclassified Fusibacter]MCK8059964.1 pilus assembly protein [Fusibacter sp. A2]NPE22106.1 pilus assembly protein [Fusibacter sp. A1]RXV60885.1 pilus assembly protein [Fusibacter sp. A1]
MRSKKKGQSVVEFAILVPVLVLVLIAIIEFGLVFNAYFVLQTSARDAARQLSLGETDANTIAQIEAQAFGLDTSKLTITITPADTSRSSGDDVTVNVIYNHTVITPLLAAFTGQELSLEVEVVMRVE